MFRKSIDFIFAFMAMTLFLKPTWGYIPDATNVEDQALTFFQNHEMLGTCVWVEFLESQPALAKGGGSRGGSGGGFGGGPGGGSSSGHIGSSSGFDNHNGPHGNASIGQNTKQQHQHEHQYQHQKTIEKQNQHQHQYQYQHRDESGEQN